MKKLALSLVVGAALAFTPLSSFALTAMSADTMKDATGQAGVSIALDDITLYQTVGDKMYIDTDGITTAANDSAGIIITGKETLTTIRAIVDDTNRNGFLKTAFAESDLAVDQVGYEHILNGSMGNRDDAYVGADGDTVGKHIEIAALSIDVSSACAISTKLNNDTAVAGVVIGLPTIEICKTGDMQTIGVRGCDEEGNNLTNGGDFIQITKENSVMAVLGGTLEIAPH